MNKRMLIYGTALAVLALLLNLVNYYYLVRAFPSQIYSALIALLFLGIGIWAGQKLSASPNKKRDEFHPNTKALAYLGISERELEVLELLSEGYSNQQIADRLYISIHTVKTHVSNLLAKLEADRRTQAVNKAKSLNLIP